MQQSEQLRKALRRVHFQRWEAQIRSELASLLGVLPETIEFVDWDEHDRLIQQVEAYRNETHAGHYPIAKLEWDVEERDAVQETLMALANKVGAPPAYLHIFEYVVSFVPYKGWETCQVPLIRFGSARSILERGLDLMDDIEDVEIILNEGKEIISLSRGTQCYSDAEPPVIRETYLIVGFGSLAAKWLSRLGE